MKNEHPEKVMEWLQSKPSLDDLGAEFPELRETVRREIAETVTGGNAAELPAYLKRMFREECALEKKSCQPRR